MSKAMIDAPSSASRTAWLRPCPRPAPVTRATFPSTRPMLEPPSSADAHDRLGDREVSVEQRVEAQRSLGAVPRGHAGAHRGDGPGRVTRVGRVEDTARHSEVDDPVEHHLQLVAPLEVLAAVARL